MLHVNTLFSSLNVFFPHQNIISNLILLSQQTLSNSPECKSVQFFFFENKNKIQSCSSKQLFMAPTNSSFCMQDIQEDSVWFFARRGKINEGLSSKFRKFHSAKAKKKIAPRCLR